MQSTGHSAAADKPGEQALYWLFPHKGHGSLSSMLGWADAVSMPSHDVQYGCKI